MLVASPAFAASGWTIAPIPPTGQNGYLLGVSADSDTDASAVGTVNRAVGSEPGALIDHWNGTSWQQSAAPSFASNLTVSLNSVSADGTSDAWAAGFDRVGRSGQPQPVTIHWNGTTWATVPAVTLGLSNYLVGVADINPADAYVVGNSTPLATGLLEQWNGTSWARLTLPDPNPANPGLPTTLNAISAPATNDVWTVGTYMIETGPTSLRYETYSLHWNGRTWSVLAMPLVSGPDQLLDYQFNSIDAISPTNVWAVGESGDNVGVGGTPTSTLIEHWNGTSWSIVPSPSPGSAPSLTGVTTSNSASSVWAVGYDTPAGATQPQTLTLNWNGSAWTTVSSPNVGAASRLVSVSTKPGAAIVWAAGYSGVSGSFSPLALENP
jgi:hypothetical protein